MNADSQNTKPPVVWALIDDRAGNRSQCLGVADALGLDGDIGAKIEHPAGLGGSPSMATAVYAGPDAADNLGYGRDYFAENADGVIGGASLVSGVLTARYQLASEPVDNRWIGENPLALRHSFANYWAGLRARIMGYPAKLPRLWDV